MEDETRLFTKDELEKMTATLAKHKKHPILFVGSGISMRYLNTPTWKELLKRISNKVNFDYKILKDRYGDNMPIIAQELEFYAVRSATLEDIKSKSCREIYRDVIAEIINEFPLDKIDCEEISEFKKMRPVYIVTTNYDELLETIYDSKYEVIIGRKSLIDSRAETEKEGILFKIHGCITEPSSIVITKEDYEDFNSKMKYIQSKLLTLFWENPLVFMGYGLGDDNIKNILTTLVEEKEHAERSDFANAVWILNKANGDDFVEKKEIELMAGKKIVVTYFELRDFYKFYRAINNVLNKPEFKELRFNVSKDELIKLLIEPLYSRQDKLEVAVRELLQNALDACKMRGVSAKIKIGLLKEDGICYLHVEDNGEGMSLPEINDYFLTVGKSGKINQKKGLIGQFGIGILTIFCIGDYAEVYTKMKDKSQFSFKIEMKNGKDTADWLHDVDDLCDEESYTIIKIKISEDILCRIKKVSLYDFKKLSGLSRYFFKDDYSIEICHFEENEKLPTLNFEHGFLKVDDELKISKKITSYLVFFDDDDELSDNTNKPGSIHNEFGKVLFNDMLYDARYDKENNYKQLNKFALPFLVINIQDPSERSGELQIGLSREDIQISGNFMKKIATNIYRLVINRALSGLKELINAKDSEHSVFEIKRILTSLHPIIQNNCDLFFQNNKVKFAQSGQIFCDYVSIWGTAEISSELYNHVYKDTNSMVLHKNLVMHKSSIADLIESDRLVCISFKYLSKYLINATNQHNGFRTKAVICLLKKLGFNDEIESKPEIAWGFVSNYKESIKLSIEKLLCARGLFWFDSENKPSESGSILKCRDMHMIVFNSYVMENMIDVDFANVLQEQFDETTELKKFIDIYK